MMKFGSIKHPGSLDTQSRPAVPQPPANAPRAGDVIFEIGVILAMHLALALVVTLLLKDCAGC